MLWLVGAALVVVMGALLAVQPLLSMRASRWPPATRSTAPCSRCWSARSPCCSPPCCCGCRCRICARIGGESPWTWTGGVIGAGVVLTALMATPRLGAATTVMLFIGGQLAASLLLDHHGWLGVPVHPIAWPRILGVLCLIAGVVLIRWS